MDRVQPRERRQARGATSCTISRKWNMQKRQIVETERRRVVARGVGMEVRGSGE